jgi:hypothetical protein
MASGMARKAAMKRGGEIMKAMAWHGGEKRKKIGSIMK